VAEFRQKVNEIRQLHVVLGSVAMYSRGLFPEQGQDGANNFFSLARNRQLTKTAQFLGSLSLIRAAIFEGVFSGDQWPYACPQ
jgi:hypothetical protein